MANSKNTIKQVPLTGTLDMNVLKTEVKQFEGYNDKNSTVFGATLSPLKTSDKKLFLSKNKWIIYNSKGDYYSNNNDFYFISKNGHDITGWPSVVYSKTYELPLPSGDILWASKVRNQNDTNTNIYFAYVDTKGLYYATKTETGELSSWNLLSSLFSSTAINFTIEMDCNPTATSTLNKGDIVIFMAGEINDGETTWRKGGLLHLRADSSSNISIIFSRDFYLSSTDEVGGMLISMMRNSGTYEINLAYSLGKMTQAPTMYKVTYNTTGSASIASSTTFYAESIDRSSWAHSVPLSYTNKTLSEIDSGYSTNSTFGEYTLDLHRYCFRNSYALNYQGSDGTTVANPTFSETSSLVYSSIPFDNSHSQSSYYTITGHDGNGWIPTGMQTSDANVQLHYQNGALISCTYLGIPITNATSIDENSLNINIMKGADRVSDRSTVITYKADGKWYCFDTCSYGYYEDVEPLIFDNRYIASSKGEYYDIETDSIIKANIGYTDSYYPCTIYSTGSSSSINDLIIYSKYLTGVMTGSGCNAAYTVNGESFVGYLPNPSVWTNFYQYDVSPATYKAGWQYIIKTYPGVQCFCTFGDNVQSAEYIGSSAEYIGTVYPIDTNSNAMLPAITWQSTVIPGFSNNDLVRINDTVYPLSYYNNNQKIYGIYLLSMLENVDSVFSLQGSSYFVDDNNIYSMEYSNGVISTVTPVTYKKNMTFVGALPTQAVFFSFYNKTFYAYTGDKILSKMFEANEINEITYVGTNPATQALWICTDKCIYIVSDDDIYRLDFAVEKVYFTEKYTILSVIEDGYYHKRVISFYDDEDTGTTLPLKLSTAYYGLGAEQKAVIDCWYIRLFDENNTEGYVKVKANTITDITRSSEEKTFHITASDYDENNIVYLRYQPQYQECTAMQLELESPVSIYSLAVGVNATDTAAQISKFNF